MPIAPDIAQQVESRLGMTLKRKWTLDRVLGIGGMAAVYSATHRNKRKVAIKMLHQQLSTDSNIRSRFLREGYVANSIDHPGVVKVDDDDVADDGSAFVVMELLEGETLEARVHRLDRPLDPTEVFTLADEALEILAAAHESDVVHRDIKPENLFLTVEGALKLLDFGIARLHEQVAADHSTGIGTFMGTPSFMAPEQARGRWDEVDHRSDLFSLGATMFWLLSRRQIHEADTVTDQLVLACTSQAPSLATMAPDLPPDVIAFVDRALSFDPAARFPHARAMQAALRDVQHGLPELHEPITAVRPPERRLTQEQRSALTLPSSDAAAAEVVSAPDAAATTPRSHDTSASTAVSRHAPALPERPSSRGRWWLVAAAILAGAVVGVVVWIAVPSSTEAPDQAPPAPAAAAEPKSSETEPEAIAPAEPEPAGEPPEPAASASAAPEPPLPVEPVVGHAPSRSKPRPPPRTPAPKPPQKPTADPFERRF